jgi:hypothetical protein
MDNEEAKHLVDQFNKLCSWQHNRAIVIIASLSLGLAFVSAFDLRSAPYVFLAVLILVGLVIVMVEELLRTIKMQRNKLFVLEKYRYENRGLPSTLTIEQVWKATEHGLRELLCPNPS